jgi:Domain of unknown function (DUF4376)
MFDLDSAFLLDGVYYVVTEIGGRPVEVSARTEAVGDVPLSDLEREAVAAIRGAVEAGDLTEITLLARGEARRPAAPTLAEVVAAKLDALAAKRYEVETGGIVLPGGLAIRTDRESQAMVGNAIRLLEERAARGEAAPNTRFKAANGWVTLGLPQLRDVGLAVGMHVDGCFRREGELTEEIEGCTMVEAVDAVDITTGWPF